MFDLIIPRPNNDKLEQQNCRIMFQRPRKWTEKKRIKPTSSDNGWPSLFTGTISLTIILLP